MPQAVVMPIAEVCDRWTIAKLKQQYAAGDPAELERQVQYYAVGIDWNDVLLTRLTADLYATNDCQWQAEDAIRKGELDNNLLEVGRQALIVRNMNRIRVQIKNQINEHVRQSFHEIKKDYAGRAPAPSCPATDSTPPG